MKLLHWIKEKKHSTLAVLCILTALALLFSGGVVTLARFFGSSRREGMAVAKPFYFSCVDDRLTEDTPYHKLEANNDGDGVISFQLCNFVDERRWTRAKFSVTWQVTSAEGVVIKDPVTVDFSGTQKETKDFSWTVAPAYISGGKRVTVTATTAGDPNDHTVLHYNKTISAQFGFDEAQGTLQYEVENSGSAVVVTISGGSGGSIQVTWPEDLAPDRTNAVLASASTNSVTFTAKKGVTYALVFLRKDQDPANEYDETDFIVAPA